MVLKQNTSSSVLDTSCTMVAAYGSVRGMEKNMLSIFYPQWLILEWLGFLPVNYHRGNAASENPAFCLGCKRAFTACVAGLIVTGQLFATYMMAEIFFISLLAPSKEVAGTSSGNMILKVLEMLPYFMMAVRPFCVMVLLLIKRSHCESLRAETIAFFQTCFRGYLPRTRQVHRWSLIAMILCALTFFMHFSWDTFELYQYVARLHFDLETDSGLLYPRITVKIYLILWALFISFPYFLSQQVYLWVVISAAILSSTLKSLKVQIREEYMAVKTNEKGHLPLEQLNEKVKTWQTAHMEMLRFGHQLEHFFSWILFVIYCCDFSILLGYTAGIVNHIHEDGWFNKNIAQYGYSVLVFVSYGTVFAIPFVKVQERSAGLLFALHELSLSVKQLSGKESSLSSELTANLKELKENMRDHTCHFSGGGLFHYTRGFLFGTFSLAVSISLLVRELVMKEMEHSANNCNAAHSNHDILQNLTVA